MQQQHPSSLDPRLRHQSRARALTGEETALAAALQEIFADGVHAFDAVASALQARGITRPSGSTDGWTEAALESELTRIDAALDASYASDGIGA